MHRFYTETINTHETFLPPIQNRFDPSLSSVAHFLIQCQSYADNCGVFTNHILFNSMFLCALDALRSIGIEVDIHLNMLLLGDFSAGKSFLMDLLMKLLISGTMEKINFRTLRVDNMPSNKNNTIAYYDELPSSMLKQSTTNGSTSETSLAASTSHKQSLANNVIITDRATQNQLTHKWSVHKTVSLTNSSTFACCNWPIERLLDGLIERMLKMSFPKNQKKYV